MEKHIAKQLALALELDADTNQDEILRQVRANKALAAEAGQQKLIIEQLRNSLRMGTPPGTGFAMPAKEPKMSLMAPLMSEKPNYTTAKFFEQMPNGEADYIGSSHQRVKSYRTTDPQLDGGLSDKSLVNQTPTNLSDLSQNLERTPEQRFQQVQVNA